MFVGVVINACVKTLVSEVSRDAYRAVKGQAVKKYKKYKKESDKKLSLNLGV